MKRNPDIDYFDLVAKLDKRFGNQDLPETARLKFQEARQKMDESIFEWADRVLALAIMAYEALPDSSINNIVIVLGLAIVRFCQGCIDKEAGLTVANSNPVDLEQALHRVQAFQHHKKAIFGSDIPYLIKTSRRDIRQSESDSESEVEFLLRGLIIPLHRGIIRLNLNQIEISCQKIVVCIQDNWIR